MSQYVLKVVKPDMTTRGGFKWAEVGGTTVAPDWSPMPTCGAGLHGWLSGIGDTSCQSISDFEGAIWLALEVEGPVIALGGKVKFQSAKVLFAGRMTDAASEVARLSGESGPVIGIVRAGGDYSTVSGGDYSTVSGGDYSTVSGGDYSTVRAGGDYSTVSGGDYSTVSGGRGATVSGGDYSTVSGGDYSTVSGGRGATVSGGIGATVSGGRGATVSGGIGATVSGGRGATVSGGDYSTVSGGDYSTVSGGRGATVSGGRGATVSGGIGAALLLSYWDARTRIVVVYVGEGGVKPHTAYNLNSQNQFEEVV